MQFSQDVRRQPRLPASVIWQSVRANREAAVAQAFSFHANREPRMSARTAQGGGVRFGRLRLEDERHAGLRYG